MSAKPPSRTASDSRDLLPPDRDQEPNSVVRAHDVAERAEEAAQRPLADGDKSPDSVISGDNLEPSGGSTGPDERQRRTAERAYYKAERRGFAPGQEDADWFEAEREIDRD